MQWSDVKKPAPAKTLRQFAALCLLIFGGMFAWRIYTGRVSPASWGFALIACIGIVGLLRPTAIGWFYRLWMTVVFPIGWTVSKLVMLVLFYLVFTPVAFVFRLLGRDELRRRRQDTSTYWTPKDSARDPKQYFNQF
jgi:hypothetical protein